MNLYLIVTLPFSPGSFHHFFIYSASIFADSEMRESLKLNLISSFFLVTFSKKRARTKHVPVPAARRRCGGGSKLRYLRSRGDGFRIRSCVCPSIMALNALMRSVFPAESEESHSPRTLTFILHCRASLCHTITLTASLGVPCNTSRLHFNCNSLPCSNTTTAEF